ncbi:type III effector Hrp-dependent outer protein [Candidatus Vecturithrix granuli]|uniref:Type III effector Hrp-dependent outer protein n=1 Tax=Vecturithrix granuli TaxID=1499967 RepID=A0A081BU99_VECG1|nr:type III effector Hrp-dependent outer protein [Candidatus Vecturithrix granuli]
MIYVIADDLTGANDTGVQFSKQGYTTHVVILSETQFQHPADLKELANTLQQGAIDVLVIDTETREADDATARIRIRSVLESLRPKPEDLVYKKVDSTLRGRIGVELDECMRLLHKDVCVFTPSFPQARRITVGGYLIVQDQPLGLSEYYSGNLTPEDASFIPSSLQTDTTFPIARIDLREVIKGRQAILDNIREAANTEKKILVIDALNDAQLQDILAGSFKYEGSILYAGSAGLANSLSTMYNGHRRLHPPAQKFSAPVCIVSGTRRSIVQQQIAYLQRNLEVYACVIDVARIFSQREALLEQTTVDVVRALQQGNHTLLYPDPRYHTTQAIQALLAQMSGDFRTLEVSIRTFFGELIARIMDIHPIKNLILTGGDTAIGVCSALQIDHLNIVAELLPGIPLSVGQYRGSFELNIVTKAGGFGDEETLYKLIQHLVPSA